MATHTPADLQVATYVKGWTLWTYRTEHDLAEVEHPDYFGGSADQVRPGDRIIVTAFDSTGRPKATATYLVMSKGDVLSWSDRFQPVELLTLERHDIASAKARAA